jgi:DNA-directed RNA polymerase subunit RPC12/RpoP
MPIVKIYSCSKCGQVISGMYGPIGSKSGKLTNCPHCGVFLPGLNQLHVNALTRYLVLALVLTGFFLFFPPAWILSVGCGIWAYFLYKKRKAALGGDAAGPAVEDRADHLPLVTSHWSPALGQPRRPRPNPRRRLTPDAKLGAGPAPSQGRFCPGCGTPTVQGDKFCVKCGRRF